MTIAEISIMREDVNGDLQPAVLDVALIVRENRPVFEVSCNECVVFVGNPRNWAGTLKTMATLSYSEHPFYADAWSQAMQKWRSDNIFYVNASYWDDDEGEDLTVQFACQWVNDYPEEMLQMASNCHDDGFFHLTRTQLQRFIRFLEEVAPIISDYHSDPVLADIAERYQAATVEYHERLGDRQRSLLDELVHKHANHYLTQTIL